MNVAEARHQTPASPALQRKPLVVHTDMRWPIGTGIYNVMEAYVSRAPSKVKIESLPVAGGVARPLTPLALTRALRAHSPRDGVFWNPGFVPPVPSLREHCPSVVTVHDLTHRHFYSRAHRTYYDYVFRLFYRRCAAVVCVSEFTRSEFLAWSGMPSDRVHVIVNGVDPVYARNRETLDYPFPYVLYPGNRRSYKNLNRLIEAFSASGLAQAGVRLLLTGDRDQSIVDHSRQCGCDGSIVFTGVLPNEAMPKLYRGALFVAFVSLYEGFGLPILEAMASGVPVLTSNLSAMPEVAGQAAVLVDPLSVQAIATAMKQLGQDRVWRDELIARGYERVRCFDWDASAAALWALVEDVGTSGSRSF
ncbi:glycosyl transferase family 1 [Paraburkholderia phytofirmans OLGA172]|uniref:Glycosyl transferase family 1 n=1 Tax=Paraburkholderia phytofirmans OLGA172 TaxID=1417228 RepID=A0A160FS58_9BURK|nr:glycosyltransferase family 1 protein [Paraburkholderia phytofirmans]ANB75644.1 glycosyl transferase family 1 [Paraburkholderia phytofirmans OLGA172]